MAIEPILREILTKKNLEIPKADKPSNHVRDVFGSVVQETDNAWLVPCRHEFRGAASVEQINDAEKTLEVGFPRQLKEFLRVSNGAKLFIAARLGLDKFEPGSLHIQYHLFGTTELIEVNRALLENFRSCLGGDPGYRHCHSLNYVAFGNAGNGDYYGIGLEGARTDQVFLVHHELYYAPYIGDGSEFLYYTIANSLEEWFQIIMTNRGWGGRGEDCGGF